MGKIERLIECTHKSDTFAAEVNLAVDHRDMHKFVIQTCMIWSIQHCTLIRLKDHNNPLLEQSTRIIAIICIMTYLFYLHLHFF
jgi:hypothetical protein